MANIIRIKRRAAGGAAGAPASLQNAELAYNESDNILYYGFGTGGAGGSATSIIGIGGSGAFQALSAKGQANGYASLDGTGKVPAAQLPAFVDDVLEYANLAGFPATGSSGILYVAQDTNQAYRWSGTAYVAIVASPGTTDAVPEGATNKYYTDVRARLAISATGDVSYNNTTGVFSYTLPTVAATKGGTGQTGYAIGDILYASGAAALSKLAAVATGNVLISGGVTTAPAWGKVGLTTHVSGTLAVGNGGTGVATLTGLVKGNGTAAMTAAVDGTDYLSPSATIDGGTY